MTGDDLALKFARGTYQDRLVIVRDIESGVYGDILYDLLRGMHNLGWDDAVAEFDFDND